MSSIPYRVNDTAPNIPITCKYKNGSVVDLTGCTVNFYIVDENGTTTNTGHTQCTITTATAGTCVYDLVSGDLPNAGTYTGLTKITLSGGEIQSEVKTHTLVVGGQYS